MVWEEDVRNDLARFWLGTTDQEAVRTAADRIDQLLSNDPDRKGVEF